MAVKRYDTMRRIVRGMDEGDLSPLDVMVHTMAIVTPRNVDRTMAALPDPVRSLFVEWARGLVAPKAPIVRFRLGESIPEHPEAREAMRGWLIRHGLLPRDAAA